MNLSDNVSMVKSSPFMTLLIVGLSLLYYGIDTYMNAETQAAEMLGMILGFFGFGMSILGFSMMGDERPTHEKYRNRRKNPVHIKSIPKGNSYKPIGQSRPPQRSGDHYGQQGMSTTVMTDEVEQEIQRLLYEGQVLQAIGLYRRTTGHGLLEAKNFIEQIARRMEEEARKKDRH